MEININGKIVLDAPGIVAAIQRLSEALTGATFGAAGVDVHPAAKSGEDKAGEHAPAANEPAPAKDEAGATEPEPDAPAPKVTMEQLRALASAKGKSNKTAVKGLLEEYGVDKLTALDTARYAAFYRELEAL